MVQANGPQHEQHSLHPDPVGHVPWKLSKRSTDLINHITIKTRIRSVNWKMCSRHTCYVYHRCGHKLFLRTWKVWIGLNRGLLVTWLDEDRSHAEEREDDEGDDNEGQLKVSEGQFHLHNCMTQSTSLQHKAPAVGQIRGGFSVFRWNTTPVVVVYPNTLSNSNNSKKKIETMLTDEVRIRILFSFWDHHLWQL